MKEYTVKFYYKYDISYKGVIKIQADTKEMAEALVNILIESKSPYIPQNWDRYEIKEDL